MRCSIIARKRERGIDMIGIVDAGVYIPRYRLTGDIFAAQWGGSSRGSRSVANHDEDALTMAWEAADVCVGHEGRAGKIDGVYLAGTSLPYAEKNNAAFLATALNLRRDVFCADFAGSLRAGTAAIRAARDAVAAGSAGSAGMILVVAAEMRLAEPSDPTERDLGDAAGALLVGNENVIAEIIDTRSTVHEFIDVWRTAGDQFLKSSDSKFTQDKGYSVFQAEAAKLILDANKIKAADLKAVVAYIPDSRSLKLIARSLNVDPKQCVSLTGDIGDAGSAAPIMGIAAALEKCKPGDLILVLSHSSGADAMLLKATDKIIGWKPGCAIAGQLSNGTPVPSYGKYLQFRGVIPSETVNPWTSPALLHREESDNWRRIGKKCNSCGAIQYPVRRVCWKCSAKDAMSDYPLGAAGAVYTFTKDHLPPNPHPPTIMVSVDVDGGGRFYTQLTDCDPKTVDVGMRVQFTMRRLHFGGGFHNYFWKFRPVSGTVDKAVS